MMKYLERLGEGVRREGAQQCCGEEDSGFYCHWLVGIRFLGSAVGGVGDEVRRTDMFRLIGGRLDGGWRATVAYFRWTSSGVSVAVSIATIVSRTHLAFRSMSSLGKSFSSFSK
jgi:hypothetical protein